MTAVVLALGGTIKARGPNGERTIPAEARKPASKAELAAAMIDEVRAEGRLPGSGGVAAEDGYAGELGELLTARGAPDEGCESAPGVDRSRLTGRTSAGRLANRSQTGPSKSSSTYLVEVTRPARRSSWSISSEG